MATYQAAVVALSADEPEALDLYAWNAKVSGAFLAPLHICEVVIRKSVSEVNEIACGHGQPEPPRRSACRQLG